MNTPKSALSPTLLSPLLIEFKEQPKEHIKSDEESVFPFNQNTQEIRKSRVRVEPQSVEGDSYIREVFCLKLNYLKVLGSIFLGIITFGLTFLVTYWFMKLKLKLLFSYVEVDDSQYFLLNNWDHKWTIVKRKQLFMPSQKDSIKWKISFYSRYHSYFYYPHEDTFKSLKFDPSLSLASLDLNKQEFSQALDPQFVEIQRKAYGTCLLDIQVPSSVQLFIKQCVHPFFIFQVFSCTVWIVEDYTYFAVLILTLTLIAAISNLVMLRNNLIQLREMAHHTIQINVVRKGSGNLPLKIQSSELVPGDIFYLRDDIQIPCDCVLLEGSVLVDESVLTGESVPVIQNCFQQQKDETFNEKTDKKSILFEGTHILQVNIPKGENKSNSINLNNNLISNNSGYSRNNSFTIFQNDNFGNVITNNNNYNKNNNTNSNNYIINNNSNNINNNLITNNNSLNTFNYIENRNVTSFISQVSPQLVNKNFQSINMPTPSPTVSSGLRAMVVNIGFSTLRGQLIRSILYPIPNKFKFLEESLRFLAVITVFTFIVYAFYIPLFLGLVSVEQIILKFLVVITISVPPALPAALQIGINFAVQRIEKERISCISPPRIIIGGRVDTVCFDQTGTLTEDRMDLIGVIPVISSKEEAKAQLFNEIVNPEEFDQNMEKFYTQTNLISDFIDCLAVCHSLTIYRKQQQNNGALGDFTLGDPMEKALFQLTGSQIEFMASEGCLTTIKKKPFKRNNTDISSGFNGISNTEKEEFGIIKRFEFMSEVQRMSVVVKQNDRNVKLYLKGAPEVIKTLCIESSIPDEYSLFVDFYANKGLRILALAVRDLDEYFENFDPQSTLSNRSEEDHQYSRLFDKDQKVQNLKRNETESQMTFLGFVFFENPIKKDSIETLRSLNKAEIASKIVTGDNALTAASVARKINMINSDEDIVIMDLNMQSKTVNILRLGEKPYVTPNLNHLIYNVVEVPNQNIINANTLLPNFPSNIDLSKNNEKKQQQMQMDHQNSGYLSCSSPSPIQNQSTFELRPLSNSIEKDPNLSSGERQIPIDFFMTEISKFALASVCITGSLFQYFFIQRMTTPEDLKLLVHIRMFARMKPNHKKVLVQYLQQVGKTVAMVGDGANDCGALKQADMGLSLSDAQASISAPFTSRDLKVQSIVNLLVQSRAGLATTFQCFQFMTLYSMIQFSGTMIQFLSFSMPTQMHYLYQDLFIVSTLFVTMSLTEPEKQLSVELPSDKLLSFQCMFSIISQIFFETATQYYICYQVTKEGEGVSSIEKNIEHFKKNMDFNDGSMEATMDFIFQNFIFLGVILAFTIGRPFQKPFYTNLYFTGALVVIWIYQIIFPFYSFLQMPGFQINPELDYQKSQDLLIFAQGYVIFCYAFEHFITGQLLKKLYSQKK